MKQEFTFLFLLVSTLAISQMEATASGLGGYFTQSDLEKVALDIQSQDENDENRKKDRNKKSFNAFAINSIIIEKLAAPLRELIVTYDEKDNLTFQARLKIIRESAYKFFIKKLPSYGQANRSDEQNKFHFYKIWKDAINFVYDEKLNDENLQELEEFKDFEEDSQEKSTYKTTLLNMLIRRTGSKHLAHKVQTLIENGADKNLNNFFSISPKMQNQSEYPLRIVLDEISNNKLRYDVLSVLLNDKITYTFNHIFDDLEEEKLKPLTNSLEVESNKDFLLKSLIEKKDFKTFSLVLDYLEKSNVFVISDYEDKISQIEDQIYCPVLEDILERMRKIRKKSYTQDKNGVQIDNISDFLNSKHLSSYINKDNHEERFGEKFVNRLEIDFSRIFEQISHQIDLYRTETEIEGAELKELVIEWVQWANFRNRIASHLNKFALSASNKGEKSNVIRLIRYANIYNQNQIFTTEEELFRELHSFGGKEIIFTKRNKYGWTPLMYAMAQKQAQGIQLYLRQAPHEISLTDGIDNNILHLAFPLPEQFYRDESNDIDSNVLQLIGADVGKNGVKEKTEESIKAIITEKSVPKKDKIKALKQLSASNFTPVSLAAAMGFLEIYTYLVDFLKGEGEWNRDDHSHLDTYIEELVVIGLKNYLNAKYSELSADEIEFIEAEIKQRQDVIDEIIKTSIHDIYDSESPITRQYLEEIIEPARNILDDYEEQKGTKRAKAPYSRALEASIKMMLQPSYIKVKVWETQKVEKKIAREVMNPNKKKSFFSKLVKKKSSSTEPETHIVYDTVITEEPVEKEDVQLSPLHGMKTARTIVKSSYLSQVLKFVVTRYLQHHTSPRLLSMPVVYKSLTDNETMDFFKQRFNETIEKRVQENIIDALKSANRFRVDELENEKSKNRFDHIEDVNNFDDTLDAFDEESFDTESSDII